MSEPCTGFQCYQDHQMRMQWKQEDIYISLGEHLKLETVVVDNSKLEPLLRKKTYAVYRYHGTEEILVYACCTIIIERILLWDSIGSF